MKFISLNQLPLYIDDFFITDFDDSRIKDAIVIHNPQDSLITSPVFLRSRKSLDEHISYIQANNIRKAYIVAEDISFLPQCPSLEYVKIYPAINAHDFDYSPLYEMPNLKSVVCLTTTGLDECGIATIDYSRLNGVKRLGISHSYGHQNVAQAGNIISLFFDFGYPKAKDLRNVIPGNILRNFSVCQAPIVSLSGIEDAPHLQRLELSYNRRLEDISALRTVKDTLAYLSIEKCGKITDFSVLRELSNLQFLTLKGSNVLKDLSFLEGLPKLRNFHLTMNVEDGDLSRCCSIPFVKVQNRKHYTHKDVDFAKDFTNPDDVLPIDID